MASSSPFLRDRQVAAASRECDQLQGFRWGAWGGPFGPDAGLMRSALPLLPLGSLPELGPAAGPRTHEGGVTGRSAAEGSVDADSRQKRFAHGLAERCVLQGAPREV